MWPEMKLVTGRARHSESNGGVERLNHTVQWWMSAWMSDSQSRSWTVHSTPATARRAHSPSGVGPQRAAPTTPMTPPPALPPLTLSKPPTPRHMRSVPPCRARGATRLPLPPHLCRCVLAAARRLCRRNEPRQARCRHRRLCPPSPRRSRPRRATSAGRAA
eukprot:scaffold236845_cov23-Tisochrysis_lutea.AAC.2